MPVHPALRRRPPDETLRWVLAQAGPGSRVASVRALRQGRSHANHAINVWDAHGARRRFVLRRWARHDWAVKDPDFDVARESIILGLLEGNGVVAPRLVAADPEGQFCDAPSLLMTRLPGHPPGPPTDLRSFLRQLAAALPPIHAVDGSGVVPAYRRYYRGGDIPPPRGSRRPLLWERALDIVARRPPDSRESFIHRDYHPGNTLWSRSRMTGVVDWTNASCGPVAIDLGHMRWNLAVDFGVEAADEFLGLYRQLTRNESDHHPYWDVVTAVDLLVNLDPIDPPDDTKLARFEAHVENALSNL
jgi:aminoglycoside phosphotransferase (APT) family kinase protein